MAQTVTSETQQTRWIPPPPAFAQASNPGLMRTTVRPIVVPHCSTVSLQLSQLLESSSRSIRPRIFGSQCAGLIKITRSALCPYIFAIRLRNKTLVFVGLVSQDECDSISFGHTERRVCVWFRKLTRLMKNGRVKSVLLFLKSKTKSSLYSRYYAEACNDWRGPSPRLHRHVAAVVSRLLRCVLFHFSGI